MTLHCTTYDSPVGELLLVGDGTALTRLSLHGAADLKAEAEPVEWSAEPLADAISQLDAYFAGALTRFDLPLAPVGSPFQQEVWSALQDIPYGTTATYSEIAAQLGRPGAARAVGLANARNPIAIIIPCHRVIGADGRLTGYGGGLDRKQQLLELEARVAGAQKTGQLQLSLPR